jgi:O-antigen ligase
MAVAGLFHSPVEGWSSVMFAAAASATGFAIWIMDREDVKRFVAMPLLAAATIQAFLAAAQLSTGAGIVPDWMANDIDVKVIDGIARPQGTMNHVYGLAALGLLALGTWIVVRRKGEASGFPALMAVAATSSLIAMTFSRSALLGVVAVVAIVGFSAIRGDHGAAILAGVIVAAYVATMLVTIPSWTTRADQTVAGDLDDASLGRLTLVIQAIDLIKSDPLTGVGPGRYEATLIEREILDEDYPYIVHNYPLAFAVENGAGAGLVIAALLIWLGVAAVRAGPSPAAAFFGLLPLLMLDVMHYGIPVGQLMLGVWLGVLAATLRWSTSHGPPGAPRRPMSA